MQELIHNNEVLKGFLNQTYRSGANLSPKEEVSVMMLRKLENIREELQNATKKYDQTEMQLSSIADEIERNNIKEKTIMAMLSSIITEDSQKELLSKVMSGVSTDGK